MIETLRKNIFELMFCLWLVAWVGNGLGYTHFDLASVWQGVTILCTLLGKWWVDSKYNSAENVPPK